MKFKLFTDRALHRMFNGAFLINKCSTSPPIKCTLFDFNNKTPFLYSTGPVIPIWKLLKIN